MLNNIEKKDSSELLKPKIMKFWVNRIKFNTPLYLIIFYSVWFFVILNEAVLTGLDNYVSQSLYIRDFITVSVSIFIIYMSITVPKNFLSLININKDLFSSKEGFENYLNYTHKVFSSKKELILPFIIAIIFAIGFFFYQGKNRLSGIVIVNNEIRHINESLLWFYYIEFFMNVIVYFFAILLVFSGFLMFLMIFKCFNELGKEKFSLKITYRDIKTGLYNNFGKSILKNTVPVLLITTILSIMGLIYIVVLKNISGGLMWLGVSLFITITILFLIYRSTLYIHKEITLFKTDLKMFLIKEIQLINDLSESEIDMNSRFLTIDNIHDYYHEVNSIRDWPFNPGSIKKLIVVFGSSILPLILSLFGLG